MTRLQLSCMADRPDDDASLAEIARWMEEGFWESVTEGIEGRTGMLSLTSETGRIGSSRYKANWGQFLGCYPTTDTEIHRTELPISQWKWVDSVLTGCGNRFYRWIEVGGVQTFWYYERWGG